MPFNDRKQWVLNTTKHEKFYGRAPSGLLTIVVLDDTLWDGHLAWTPIDKTTGTSLYLPTIVNFGRPWAPTSLSGLFQGYGEFYVAMNSDLFFLYRDEIWPLGTVFTQVTG